MKKLFLLLFFSQTLLAQKNKIEIKITYLEPYCGGAKPSPEIERQSKLPQAYSNKKLIVVFKKCHIDTLITNDSGAVFLPLKKGIYKIYEPWRYYKKTPNNEPISMFNKTCIKQEWEKENIHVQIHSKNKIEITKKISFNAYCPWREPCVNEINKAPARE
ncbi:MAG: hypothetical protein JSU07_11610 [Bacteroidetes bacterium]|nr:hypothetical protein [Bacteroidota bacterium]